MFRTTMLWLWMTALLTSTVGISVTQIYCYCVGQTTYAFFQEAEDACAADRAPKNGACCKDDPPECCMAEALLDNDDHSCTKKTVKVFQMKADYLVGHPLEKTLDCPLWAEELPDFLRLSRPKMCLAAPSNKAPPEPPPPLSGRQICVRHELFRC